MKRVGIVAAFLYVLCVSVAARAQTPSTLPLVQQSDLVPIGSARLPNIGAVDTDGFPYGGLQPTFNPARGTLYLHGYETLDKVAELNLPATWGTGPLSGLPVLSVRQPLTSVTEGKMSAINPTDPNTKLLGGLLLSGGSLFATGYSYYDGAGTQTLAIFKTSPDLSVTGEVLGPLQVGTLPARMIAGYMGPVPQAWQSLLGGPAFIGQCCLAIVNNTSSGPALFTFDPADVGVKSPVPVNPLVYYPATNPLAGWGTTNPYYNGSTQIRGVVMIEGTRTVLFVGRHGTGTFCYGPGTSNLALVGTVGTGFIEPYCYDPADAGKGTHAYPYVYQGWAYDANDFVKVRQGLMKPWEVRPYAIWHLTFPYPAAGTNLDGVAYDPATQRLFLSQAMVEGDWQSKPLIHAYQVNIPTVTPTPTPNQNCDVEWSPWSPFVSDGTRLVSSRTIVTVLTPQSGTGTACPVSPEYQYQPLPPPVIVPPAIVVRSTMTVKTCTLVLEDDPPDTSTGWGVQFYRNPGVKQGSRKTSAPYRQTAVVPAGIYLKSSVWTKTGQSTVTRGPVPAPCPTP
jgi:hypothetical protein